MTSSAARIGWTSRTHSQLDGVTMFERNLYATHPHMMEQQIVGRISTGACGKPSRLAGAVAFLASAALSYVQDHVLAVDAGWLAR